MSPEELERRARNILGPKLNGIEQWAYDAQVQLLIFNLREVATAAYRQAYTEAADLVEDLRGKNVGSHADHYAGLWAAFRMAASEHSPLEE